MSLAQSSLPKLLWTQPSLKDERPLESRPADCVSLVVWVLLDVGVAMTDVQALLAMS